MTDPLEASRARLAASLEPYRVLDADGVPARPLPDLSDEQLRQLYRWMVLGRALDERALQLQRQGRLIVWAPLRGQEAEQVGLGLALAPQDWLFPSYREPITLLMHGLDLADLLAYYRGLGWAADPRQSGVFPMQILIGDQTPHAVGAGIAFALRGEPRVAVAIVGDGATSQGDFHEALNFGGVFHSRAVIFVANNQWAISVPRARQSLSVTLAEKALAHGIEGLLVDGNDPLAVYSIARHALEQARAGNGPLLVEALTYRLGAHTTADDPTRYRPQQEVQEWSARDPLLRTRRFLEGRRLWDAASEAAAHAEALARVDEAMARCERMSPPPFRRALETAFAAPTARLREQIDEVSGTT